MTTMLEAMAKANLVKPDDAKAASDNAHFRSTIADMMDGPFKRRKPSAFTSKGIQSVLASHRRNPSVSGSVPADARARDAAGSDSNRIRAMSGPSTPFGMPGRSTKVKR
jgi:hypothetical protein